MTHVNAESVPAGRAAWCRARVALVGLLAVGPLGPVPHARAQGAHATGIVVDGELRDWRATASAYVDHPDAADDHVDFGSLWITNDDRFLLMGLEVGKELSLQDVNDVTLYVDTDDNRRTGVRVHGLGADLVWHFGERTGFRVSGTDSVRVEHQDVGLVTAPTVTARAFEIVLDRRAGLADGNPLFPGSVIRIAYTDLREGGDVLPDHEGGVPYTFVESDSRITPIPLAKRDQRHVRVVSHNVNNRLFRARRREAYERILSALRPDVLVLQEVRDHSSSDVLDHLVTMLPQPRAGTWYHARAGGEGNVVISPYPIVSVHALGQSGAFVLDPGGDGTSPLLLVSLSAPCCDQNEARQRELDVIMSFIRDSRSAEGQLDLAFESPILLIGDANLVGYAEQRETLVQGHIVNSAEFGAPFSPDWDGTAFTDLTPRHTHDPLTFTWYGREFSPGRLDYVVYSDAVLDVGNHFILYTPAMSDVSLVRHGLRAEDVRVASNHLPVVVDLVWP